MQSPYGTTKEHAERLAAGLRIKRIGRHASLTSNGYNKTVTDYQVTLYTNTTLWGVVERWRYSDRPDLGEFGGAFIDLMDAGRVLTGLAGG